MHDFSSHGMKLKMSMSDLAKCSIFLLGHIVKGKRVEVDPGKLKVVCDASKPDNLTILRILLEIAGYYRRFKRSFALISEPQHAATFANVRFDWKEEKKNSFKFLKEAITRPPVLAFADL